MKKITLFFALILVSSIGLAQESNKTSNSNSETLERETEYIIVLDDIIVDDNIDKLLNGSGIDDNHEAIFVNHELAHDAPNTTDIESKFVEGAFTYNEYAMNYGSDPDHQNELRS